MDGWSLSKGEVLIELYWHKLDDHLDGIYDQMETGSR